METRKPIKRNKAIAPLSRDHHDGLLLCWKIRFGIKNEVDTKRIGNYVRYFWESHLQEHFRKEEVHLFTLLPEQNEKRVEAFSQHKNISELIQQIANQPNYIILSKLAADLESHIRFEERDLFNLIQESADEATINQLEILLADDYRTKEDWNDMFWEKK